MKREWTFKPTRHKNNAGVICMDGSEFHFNGDTRWSDINMPLHEAIAMHYVNTGVKSGHVKLQVFADE